MNHELSQTAGSSPFREVGAPIQTRESLLPSMYHVANIPRDTRLLRPLLQTHSSCKTCRKLPKQCQAESCCETTTYFFNTIFRTIYSHSHFGPAAGTPQARRQLSAIPGGTAVGREDNPETAAAEITQSSCKLDNRSIFSAFTWDGQTTTSP